MTDEPIRVGFIGLNPGVHWAATAHIPALKALPDDYQVVGVRTPALPAREEPPAHSACFRDAVALHETLNAIEHSAARKDPK